MICSFAIALSAVLGAHEHPAWEDFGLIEWLAIGAASLFVVWTIWLAVKYTIMPGEDAQDHYKRLILEGPESWKPESWERESPELGSGDDEHRGEE